MKSQHNSHCTAFDGSRSIASGELVEVIKTVKEALDKGEALSILIFDDESSEIVEVDFRVTMDEVLKSLGNPSEIADSSADVIREEIIHRGPGRPKLGVIPREVTLLPRHWEWLNSQPGGASVALRKLVEEARRINSDRDQLRNSQGGVYRFMSAMGGDLPGFEEAARALFTGNHEKFNEKISAWPVDIRNHLQKLSLHAFMNEA